MRSSQKADYTKFAPTRPDLVPYRFRNCTEQRPQAKGVQAGALGVTEYSYPSVRKYRAKAALVNEKLAFEEW